MRRDWLNRRLLCLFFCSFFVLVAVWGSTLNFADETTAMPTAPVATTPAPPAASAAAPNTPQVGWGKTTRAERKLAQKIRNDAAEILGMRRVEFLRTLNAEIKAKKINRQAATPCLNQLKLSLLECPEAIELGIINERTGEIDVDRFQEILRIILDFLSQLFAMFQMFVDAMSVDAYILCSSGLEAPPAPNQVQDKPAQNKLGSCCQKPIRRVIKAVVTAPVKAVASLGDFRSQRQKPIRRIIKAVVASPVKATAALRCQKPIRRGIKAVVTAPVKATTAKVQRAKARRVGRRCCAA